LVFFSCNPKPSRLVRFFSNLSLPLANFRMSLCPLVVRDLDTPFGSILDRSYSRDRFTNESSCFFFLSFLLLKRGGGSFALSRLASDFVTIPPSLELCPCKDTLFRGICSLFCGQRLFRFVVSRTFFFQYQLWPPFFFSFLTDPFC